ncbi:VanW family protein [Gaiella sp.]|uniref:VanW family protein n=1 Tax=Gaiella sp. TaxID=2663207 RepID=UPI0032679CDB
MRAETTVYSSRARQRHSTRRIALRRAVFLAAVFALLVLLIGFSFSGSASALAAGTTVGGVDVGGLSQGEAVRMLTVRSAAVEDAPITFTADGTSYTLSASQLGVAANWEAAVREAASAGGGVAPVRGYKRLQARFFGVDSTPPVTAYDAAVDYKLGQIAKEVARSGVDAKVVRKGLTVQIVEGQGGRKLDQVAAAAVVVQSLARFDRGTPVALPLVTTPLRVGAADLDAAAAKARVALSAPIRLAYGETRWRIPRWKVASLIELPVAGNTDVAIAGRGAEEYLERLSATIAREPQDARFEVTATGTIVVRPSAPGLLLDTPATAKAIAAAAFSADQRTAKLVVRVAEPVRTTADAKAMGITGVVASYTTTYGGTPGRLNNVQLVSELIDGTLIAPGGTFSFNETTGERTAERGFQEAPVIINGELQNGLGGGVCQVSTTVFNAAYEGGLPITARTNHALYISHYPTGRDATVNYPDLDIRFANDTGRWLLLRTFVGTGSLTVNLYGTPVNRRVESTVAPLVVTGPIPVEKTDEPTLEKGKRVVEEIGSPPRETSVRRLVYDGNDELLYDNTWRSFYVGEPSLVRIGTKEPPKKPGGKAKTGRSGTPPTATTPTGTATTPVAPATSAQP